MDPNQVLHDKHERLERVATLVSLLVATVVLQILDAPESLVGGALGAAAALVVPGGSRTRSIVAAGAGAALGAMLGGWIPSGLA